MDFVNQHNAWIAAEISAVAGVGSFVVAFIANREKVWDFIKKNWFYIVGIFAFVGLWSLYQNGVFASWVRGLGNFFSVSIPIWAGFTAVAIVIVVWWIFQNISIRRIPDEKPTQHTPPKPSHKPSQNNFHVRDYVEDLIDGVWWHWSFSGNTVGVPKPICPNKNCQCDLFFHEDWARVNYSPNIASYGQPPVTLKCPRCRFSIDFDKPEGHVLHEITQEILSRIRTDRFREILSDRLKNQGN